ncbi:MAG: arsenite methyltransferase [Spirochaetales bacterium]|nr:arsenite methyltransferase [Spirochaetales bacterium]
MPHTTNDEVRTAVRDRYRKAATASQSCCGGADSGSASCGCGSSQKSTDIGYTAIELAALPEGADLALGCGNPTALAGITAGETVLDLGSGGGIDCFLASKRVGPTGKVIGIDMTAEMISKARANAVRGGYDSVEFRLGEIENIPVADSSVDLIISNCVINLSPDKGRVFAEAFRVLKPGGRLMISDPVLLKPLPEDLKDNVALLTGCIAGAMVKEEYLAEIRNAGFENVRVERESQYAKPEHLSSLAVEAGISAETVALVAESVASVAIFARK